MKLLVLAGGFGTRLQSVVSDVPKALAPVGNVPFLYLQIEHWIAQGVRSFVFLLHHRADLIIGFLKSEQSSLLKGCEVQWLTESSPMGTGGALAYAIDHLNISGGFLATNADTWIGTGINEVWRADSPALVVVKVEDAGRYGCIRFDDKKLITDFQEKNAALEAVWINAGLCHLTTELFKDWDHEPFSLERVSFPLWATRGALKAVPSQSDFIDIGIPEDYFRFCRWIESGKIGVP